MRLLLDTHIALWAILDDARLPKSAADLIADPGNTVSVIAVSVWEISIKHGLDRLIDMPVSGPQALAFFRAAGYEMLAISTEHAAAVQSLPDLHRDLCDRLIVAQALTEPLILLTSDAVVAEYSSTGIRLV